MEDEKKKVYLIHWGLLGEWWHADKDATREEIEKAVFDHMNVADMRVTQKQVSQRIYGGFPCDEGGQHFYHNTGQYTYTGVNWDATADDRKESWRKLIEGNSDQTIDTSMPFAEDALDYQKAAAEEWAALND